jgi:hypothetical protein
VIIHQTLYDLFPPATIPPALTHPLTPAEFIRQILAPQVGLMLIQEDLGVGVREALETMRESVQYGVGMFPHGGDEGGSGEGAVGVVEAMMVERARRRRKELEREEKEEEELLEREKEEKERMERDAAIEVKGKGKGKGKSKEKKKETTSEVEVLSPTTPRPRPRPRPRAQNAPVAPSRSRSIAIDVSEEDPVEVTPKPRPKTAASCDVATPTSSNGAPRLDLTKMSRGKTKAKHTPNPWRTSFRSRSPSTISLSSSEASVHECVRVRSEDYRWLLDDTSQSGEG